LFGLGLVVLLVFFVFLFLLFVFLVLTVFFLLFCYFMVANSMGLCLSGNRDINKYDDDFAIDVLTLLAGIKEGHVDSLNCTQKRFPRETSGAP